MADTDRTPSHRVTWLRELERSPQTFHFHAALRRLECLYPEQPRLGQAVHPGDEPVRLGQEPTLAFAPDSFSSFEPREGRPARLTISFLGLFGPHGPLPLHLTEYARDRQRNAGDRTLVAFADLFHHRMLLLFHRAWAAAQPTVGQDRPASNPFDLYLGAFIGLGLRSLRQGDAVAHSTRLYYAGRLACPTRNAEGLSAMLGDYFGAGVEIEQFVGDWIELPEQARWQLGVSQAASTVAESTILGARVWNSDHKFRIVLGPLSASDFDRFLPGGEGLARLTSLVRSYVGLELSWDLRLVLGGDQTGRLQLGGGSRLGYTSRLGSDARSDLIVEPSPGVTRRTLCRGDAASTTPSARESP